MARVTEVCARFHAGCIDVCKEGSVVALHFSTPQGVVVITAELREFVQKLRGARDHIGNPLPTPEDLVVRQIEPATVAVLESPPRVCPRGRMGRPPLSGVKLQKYEAAARDLLAGTYATKAATARAHGCDYTAWLKWLERHVVTTRPPILKPGGKIL